MKFKRGLRLVWHSVIFSTFLTYRLTIFTNTWQYTKIKHARMEKRYVDNARVGWKSCTSFAFLVWLKCVFTWFTLHTSFSYFRFMTVDRQLLQNYASTPTINAKTIEVLMLKNTLALGGMSSPLVRVAGSINELVILARCARWCFSEFLNW